MVISIFFILALYYICEGNCEMNLANVNGIDVSYFGTTSYFYVFFLCRIHWI